jgi:hypothetical protein
MKRVFRRALAVVGALLLAVNSNAQTVNFPIVVPLHFTQIASGTDKLGIYLGIGSGATPALFEFDTGATGFYATYSPNPGVSPWWGSDVISNPTPVEISYASGLHYTGNLAAASITLFASSDPSSARIATPAITQIGQIDSIINDKDGTTIWNSDGSVSGGPPVNGAFYGDFGMGLTFNPNGIINVLAQLTYGRGVIPGFRIHANPLTQKAFLQIELTRRDVRNPSALYFPMNMDSAAGGKKTPSGLNYFSQQVFDATIHITDHKGNNSLRSPGVGMITDTGATTALQNIQNSPAPLPTKYQAFITWDSTEQTAGQLNDGLTF